MGEIMIPRKRLLTLVSWLCAGIFVVFCGRTILSYLTTTSTNDPASRLHLSPKNIAVVNGKRSVNIPDKVKRDGKHAIGAGKHAVKRASPRLYVGIDSRGKTPGANALACRNTWGKNKQVTKMEFFVSAPRPTNKLADSTVYLGSGDTTHSSHIKTARMLTYLCTHHLSRYEWFLLSQESSYVKVKEMMSEIKDNHMHVYIEATDLAKRKSGSPICVDAKHILFARSSLTSMCPYIKACTTGSSVDSTVQACLKRISKTLCQKMVVMPGASLSHMDPKTMQTGLTKKNSPLQKTFKKIHVLHSIKSAKELNQIHDIYTKFKKSKPGGKKRRTVYYFKKNAWKHHVS